MHTPSTRILSALAYDRGEEYDPAEPVAPGAGRGAVAGRARRAGDRRRRPVRAGAPAPARARPRAGGDPGLVLGAGPDRRAVGDRGSSASSDRSAASAAAELGTRAARAASARPIASAVAAGRRTGRSAAASTTSHLQEVTCPTTTEATILVAEEHDATRAFLADNLTADGYRVLIAPDRAKALALLSHRAPGPDPRRRQRADARAARRDPLRRGARRPRRSRTRR